MIPKKILFCTDFSENSTKARQCAIEYARAFDAHLMILHVVNTSQIGYPSVEGKSVPLDIRSTVESIQESVDRALGMLAEECGKTVKEVTTWSRVGVPATEIVRIAVDEAVGLIVMGTHGWTGFKHLIMGSTAENVVRTADCPVLTVKSTDGDEG